MWLLKECGEEGLEWSVRRGEGELGVDERRWRTSRGGWPNEAVFIDDEVYLPSTCHRMLKCCPESMLNTCPVYRLGNERRGQRFWYPRDRDGVLRIEAAKERR